MDLIQVIPIIGAIALGLLLIKLALDTRKTIKESHK